MIDDLRIGLIFQYFIVFTGLSVVFTSDKHKKLVVFTSISYMLMNAFWIIGDTTTKVPHPDNLYIMVGDWVMYICMLVQNIYFLIKNLYIVKSK